MFGKRPPYSPSAKAVAIAARVSVYADVFHPVHIGIFLAALLFGMNA